MKRMKPCRRCGETKALTAFAKNPKLRDGHLNQCRECINKRNREREAAKPAPPRPPCTVCTIPLPKGKSLFCSVECRTESYKTEATCAHCGLQYRHSRYSDQSYCSSDCSAASVRERTERRLCRHCRQPFVGKRVFCSSKCHTEAVDQGFQIASRERARRLAEMYAKMDIRDFLKLTAKDLRRIEQGIS